MVMMYKGYEIYSPFIFGETSTLRINPDIGDTRIDSKTKELIKNHGYKSSNPKNYTIYVGKAEFYKEDEYSSYMGHALFWGSDKDSALRGALLGTRERIDNLVKSHKERKRVTKALNSIKPVSVSKSKNRRNKAYRRKKPRRNIARDKQLRAKKMGRRVSASGKVYYESRPNRSDRNPSTGL